jgi:hypothetical protein
MDQLTLLPEDSLANLTASPGNAEATMMTVRSGRKCSESYERQGPLGSLARMCLESSAWHSTACLLIWSVKATPARRSCFQLAPWMPSIDETESGLWATPNVPNGGRSVAHVKDWRGKTAYHNGKKVQVGLESQVKMWPTPVANDDNKSPEAHMRMKARMKGGARSTITSLQVMAKAVERGLLPTPTVGDSRNARNSTAVRHKIPPTGIHAGDTLTDAVVPQGGSLNPTWVEWLMGYPLGWTDLKDSETPLCPKSPPRSSRKSSKSTTAP